MPCRAAQQLPPEAAILVVIEDVERLDLAIPQPGFHPAAVAAGGAEPQHRRLVPAAIGGRHMHGEPEPDAMLVIMREPRDGEAGQHLLGQNISISATPSGDMHRGNARCVRRPGAADRDHGSRTRTAAKKPSVPLAFGLSRKVGAPRKLSGAPRGTILKPGVRAKNASSCASFSSLSNEQVA